MAARERNFFDTDGIEEYFYVENDDSPSNSSEDDEITGDDSDGEGNAEIIERLQRYEQIEREESNQNHENEIQPQVNVETDTPTAIKEKAHCKCALGSCIGTFDPELIEKQRELNKSLDKTSLDLVILAKISTLINRNPNTSATSHKPQERRLSRTGYKHEGKITFAKVTPSLWNLPIYCF